MPNQSVAIDFINTFIDATVHVLKIQVEIEARPGPIFLKRPDQVVLGDITGIVGIAARTFNGVLAISIPEKTFLKILSKMLSEDVFKVDSDNIDGAAELTNMIFGHAKISLNEKGLGIKPSIPKSYLCTEAPPPFALGPMIVVPFSTEHGDFFVEIGIHH
jgi:chemotaxis protein CheX